MTKFGFSKQSVKSRKVKTFCRKVEDSIARILRLVAKTIQPLKKMCPS